MSDKPWTETDTDRAEQDVEAYGAIMAPEGVRIIAEVKRLTAEIKSLKDDVDDYRTAALANQHRLRDLLREAKPRIKPEPTARHPEDWEPDDLGARIAAELAKA